jgi:hypothetical protein
MRADLPGAAFANQRGDFIWVNAATEADGHVRQSLIDIRRILEVDQRDTEIDLASGVAPAEPEHERRTRKPRSVNAGRYFTKYFVKAPPA